MKAWYLIYTKPRQEKIAQSHLERQGYRIYLPLTKQRKRYRSKWQEVIEPLFPSYLFIYLSSDTDNWKPIRSTRGVNRLVQFGDTPMVVPNELIEVITGNQDGEGYIAIDIDAPQKGDPIRVAEGSLEGIEGIFVENKGENRVIVLLNIVGNLTRTALDVIQIEKMDK